MRMKSLIWLIESAVQKSCNKPRIIAGWTHMLSKRRLEVIRMMRKTKIIIKIKMTMQTSSKTRSRNFRNRLIKNKMLTMKWTNF